MCAIYKSLCAGCNASYIGETVTQHLYTRVFEHFLSDKSLHVYRHLQSSRASPDSEAAECFMILDSATAKFQIKIREALQLKHLDLSLYF